MTIPTIAAAEIRPLDLLIASALLNPTERERCLQAEVAAFCELSKILAEDPRVALRRFLEIALRLCNAGTAGLSLLRPNGAGQTTVRWEAVSGALASYEGADSQRDFSPCGLCLDAGTTVLVSRPERVFTYLRATQPSIVQDLIVPLYDNTGKPLGTFWIAHHDATSRFSSDDARMVEQLSIQLVLALKLLEQARAHRHTLALLEAQRMVQRTLAHVLDQERHRHREQAEASENGFRQALVFRDTVIREAHHRVKNTLQIAASLLSLHARATPSARVRSALHESYGRLRLLAKVHELLDTTAGRTQEVLMPTLLLAMAEALRQSFAEMSDRVRLEVTSDQAMLSPDDAIPLALLANEVMTNAYKHAFPDGRSGEITLSLRGAPESALILQITDNGIGMQSGSVGSSGLGLKLVRTLATQLRGTLRVAKPVDATGTTVTLVLNRANGSRRRQNRQ